MAWTGRNQTPQVSEAPVTVTEVDVVGDVGQSVNHLPGGVRLLSSRQVDNYLVYRFALRRPWRAVTPQEIGRRAATLVGPASGLPAVLIQSAAR
jgi:hypothetical protein